jgi:hypothetical protein
MSVKDAELFMILKRENQLLFAKDSIQSVKNAFINLINRHSRSASNVEKRSILNNFTLTIWL